MVQFTNLLRFDADVTASNAVGPWGVLFPRRVANAADDTFKSSHDGAHGVGANQSSRIAIYKAINDVLSDAGLSGIDVDGPSNGTLLPNSTQGGIIQSVAAHTGEPNSFQSILSDGAIGDRYLDQPNCQLREDLIFAQCGDLRDAMDVRAPMTDRGSLPQR